MFVPLFTGVLFYTPAQASNSAGTPVSLDVKTISPYQYKKNHSRRVVRQIKKRSRKFGPPISPPLVFDLPVTYNERVKFWLNYFQTRGKKWFRVWLERSGKYLPMMLKKLEKAQLPLDLAYIPMIESGFSSAATSVAQAAGYWQFIQSTGRRFGLKTDWWIDERRDPEKSTDAAVKYLRKLYRQFGSWYLVAASYNMGENGMARRIKRYRTSDFWELANLGALPVETRNYVPKLIAAMLISKAPGLYGFRKINPRPPLKYDLISAPGGTDLINLADFLSITRKHLKSLNPELIKGFIPRGVRKHQIRIPHGSKSLVRDYFLGKIRKNT